MTMPSPLVGGVQVHWKDLDKVSELAESNPRLVCPFFLKDPDSYLALLDEIAEQNGID